ncbi:MAG: flagellar biosynthetic protein FliO [Verrucomicrobia bacterium]|nr:flagellar biosynthetic protein FliO [Verrucomicrobiota bacterium]
MPASLNTGDAAATVARVFGALAFVLALFLGGVWLWRNWQRLAVKRGREPKLNVLEVKSLGQRHTLFVVGYEQQRLLLSASPTGVTLLSHLPVAGEGDEKSEPVVATANFADALRGALARKA